MITDYIVICSVALIASALTLFSGFGLGTILTPVFAIFFPIELAVALTAIVHLLNNIFKLILVGRHIDKNIVLKFGIPSVIAAFLGAFLLNYLAKLGVITQYQTGSHTFSITPVKILIGSLLIFFALYDLIPKLSKLEFNKKYLPLGGLVSGFFGGLSGHQGALRSAFLLRSGLTKESFIATGVSIACMVDITRLIVYSDNILKHKDELEYPLIAAASLAAFAGAFIGTKLIKKVTVQFIQIIVAIMLLIFAILLIAGIL